MAVIEQGAYAIRLARSSELGSLADIEIDAFVTLRDALGIARDGGRTVPLPKLVDSFNAELLYVAADDLDHPFAFLAAAELDGAIYVTEIDVMQRWQRKGVGRHLMRRIIDAAQKRGASGVTLTTDRHVPFNAPFYASLGFRVLDEREMSAGLLDILRFEIAHAENPERRVAMALWF